MLKVFLLVVFLCFPSLAGAQRVVQSEGFSYGVDAVPSWVQPPPPRPAAPWNGRSAVRYLLIDTQVNLSGGEPVRFTRVSVTASDPAGLAQASELHIRFNPEYETIVLHEVGVTRDGRRVDRLPALKVELLQRETQLEQSIYDGVVTAFAVIRDVRVGDVVDFSYSVRGANPVFGGKHAAHYVLNHVYPTDVRRVRIEHPASRPLQHKVLGLSVLPTVDTRKASSVLELTLAGLAPVYVEDRLPYWAVPFPELLVSEYQDWTEVQRWANAHFRARTEAAPELTAVAARIKAEAGTPEEMTARALAFAQDEIRYFAVETGTNSHVPSPPGETLRRRYGDCKDKAVLLVALLRAVGVEARPALVSFQRRRQVSDLLPSPLAFDHVIVAASVAGRTHWLDPTRTYQGRRLSNLGFEPFEKSLVVQDGAGALVNVTEPPAFEDSLHITERFVLRNYSGPLELRIVGRSRGAQAERLRAHLAGKSAEVFDGELSDDVARRYQGAKRLRAAQVTDDRTKNELVIEEAYELPRLFTYSRGLVMHAFTASSMINAVHAPENVIRRAPMALPYRASSTHRFEYELPNELRLSFSQPLKITSPQVEFGYRAEQQGRVLVFEFGLRFLRDHVAPGEMPAYLDRLGKVREQLNRQIQLPVYDPEKTQRSIVSAVDAMRPRLGNMPIWASRYQVRSLAARMRSEAAIASGAIEGRDLTTARVEVAVELSNSGDRPKALEVLDEAIAADPAAAAAHARRGEVLAYMGRFEEALAALDRANAIEPESASAYTRSHALYYLARYKQAHDMLTAEAARTTGAEQTHRLLWLSLNALNLKLDPNEVVRQAGYGGARSEWPGPILSYLLDEIGEDKLYAAAREDPEQREPRLCEAWYFVGQRWLLAGAQARAKEAFQNAVGTQVTPYIEYAYSDVELKRIP